MNKITLNVLGGITRKINNGGIEASSNNILILFNGTNMDLDNKIIELKKLIENNFNLSLGFSFMSKGVLNIDEIVNVLNPRRVYGEENIFDLENIVERHSKLIMPNISINTLSKVALGMIDSFASNILWTYLYKGKDVYLDFSSAKNYLGSSSQNKTINSIINKHINTLKNMGAMEIEEGKYIKIIGGNREGLNKVENLGGFKEFSKVVTERDLFNFSLDTKVLKLPKGTILTPLAKDRAKELGLKIEIEE